MQELVKYIKDGKCILFIGPYLNLLEHSNGELTSIADYYCNRMRENLTKESIAFDPSAIRTPYYLASKYLDGSKIRKNTEYDLVKEIDRLPTTKSFSELCILPFNTIVNFGFDHFARRSLDKAGYDYEFRYYNYNGQDNIATGVEKDMPLIYNMFGTLDLERDETTSRIITENNQLAYIRAINFSPKLPTDLTARISQGTKKYIFLGFDFNDWSFRILLNALEINKENVSFTPNDCNSMVAIMTHDFYKDRFGIDFLDATPSSFIDKLLTEYRSNTYAHTHAYILFNSTDSTQKNLLREHLINHSLTINRNIKFFDQDDLHLAQTKDDLNKMFESSTLFIPLLSSKAINDPEIIERMDKLAEKNNIQVFPIIVGTCLWEKKFPFLLEKASFVLPENQIPINSTQKKFDDEDYIKILNIIHTKIR